MVESRHLVALPVAVVLAVSAPVAGASVPTLETVAGSGPTWPAGGGFRGDGGLATATDADFNRPAQVEALPGGGYLIADSSNQRIRRVATDGTLSTLAGDGNQCSGPTERCGDGGDPLAASLNTPHDVAVLPDGAILIADTFDNPIREVSPDGQRITTVAGTGDSCTPSLDPCGHGGPAVDAQLSLPLAVDPLPDGDFLVADQGQIAGAPDQKLSRIRLVHDGRMLLLAGAGGWGFHGDGGPALDATFNAVVDVDALPDGSMLVSDGSNCRVRRIDPGGTIHPLAGYAASSTPGSCISLTASADVGDGGPALDASFNGTAYLAPAADGTVYVVDIFNSRIRSIAPDGTISTLAGTGEQPNFNGESGPADQMQLAWPSGISLDGQILISDPGNNRVRRIAASATPPTLPATWVPGVRAPAYVSDVDDVDASGNATATVRCPAEPGRRPCVGSVRADGGPPAAFALDDGADGRVVVMVPSPPEPGVQRDASLATATRQPSGDDGTLSVTWTLTGAAAVVTAPPPSSTTEAPPATTTTSAPSAQGGAPAASPPPRVAPPPPDARVLLPRRATGRTVPVAIACTATCTATIASGGASPRHRTLALTGARVVTVPGGRISVTVDRPGAAPLRVRTRTTPNAAALAALACTAACTARARIAVHGHTLAQATANLRAAGQAVLAPRAQSRAEARGRAVAETTLSGAGPDQTVRQVLSATAARSAGR